MVAPRGWATVTMNYRRPGGTDVKASEIDVGGDRRGAIPRPGTRGEVELKPSAGRGMRGWQQAFWARRGLRLTGESDCATNM
jgi:hypothetical protein